MRKLGLITLIGGAMMLAGLLAAQSTQSTPPQQTAPTPPAQQGDYGIVVHVTNIVAPVKVFDSEGNMVNGIKGEDFHLFDNKEEQNIRVDEHYIPISMVIAIQCNGEVDHILPQINRIGNLIGPMMLGAQGEAAVIAFDHRIRTLQDFTSDPDKISDAIKKIHSGSMSAALVDAVDAGEHMLRNRPRDRQKIILLISETRDQGSINRGRETLYNLQLSNVSVYQVTVSRIMGKLTETPPDPRPDPIMTTAHPMPPIVPATPTTVMQTYGTEGNSVSFIPLFVELFQDAKGIFKAPAAQMFTKGTGGAQFGFYRGRGLEDAIQRMSEELHSQYMLTYSPTNKDEGGWHTISVTVSSHGKVKAETRPGYWIAADFR